MPSDFENYLHKQIVVAKKHFGPGYNYKGILDHIRKETVEIEAKPEDLEEWIDILLLAFDGAWRCVARYYNSQPDDIPATVIGMLNMKLNKNDNRKWPDWRTADPDKAIEHLD